MLGEPGSALCATRESHPYILGPPGTAECADDDHEPVSMAECNVAVALLFDSEPHGRAAGVEKVDWNFLMKKGLDPGHP